MGYWKTGVNQPVSHILLQSRTWSSCQTTSQCWEASLQLLTVQGIGQQRSTCGENVAAAADPSLQKQGHQSASAKVAKKPHPQYQGSSAVFV